MRTNKAELCLVRAQESRGKQKRSFCGGKIRNGNDEFALENFTEPFSASAARQSPLSIIKLSARGVFYWWIRNFNFCFKYNICMKFIEFEVKTGAENMQMDNDLLESAIKNKLQEPIFRLYGWAPSCVSLGRNQRDEFLDKDFLKSKGIDTVRRMTGGRALLHDKELTYSYICPTSFLKNGDNVVQSYKEISQILIDAFKNLGIELEFPENKRVHTKFDYCMNISTGADLCYQGKKLIGSAQYRKDGYILQHGSILFDYDKELIEKIFMQKTDENSLTCLLEINPSLTYEKVVSAINGYSRLDLNNY